MNKIEIFENTLLKLLIRRGLDSERKNIILEQGELGYSTDTKRTFIGDGVTEGGVLIGNKFLGSDPDITTLSPGEIGDIAFDSDNSKLFIIKEGTGSVISDWEYVSGIYYSGNNTINIDATNNITVGTLSAGNFSDDTVGNSIEIDNDDRIAIKSDIEIDSISQRDNDINSFLTLPKRIEIDNIQYTMPSNTPTSQDFLRGTTGSTELEWAIPEIITTGVPTTTASIVPVGTITQFVSAGADVPYGWLVCDGATYDTDDYQELFDLIGYEYGGSGTSFDVPDYVDHFIYGDITPEIGSTPLTLGTGASTIQTKGIVFIVKAIGGYSAPSLTVNSPLEITLDSVDVTGTSINPLDGDVEIGLSSSGVPGLTAFKAAGEYTWEVPAGITYIKYHVTGSGQYGGHLKTGAAADTAVGYLSASPGKELTIVVGDQSAEVNNSLGWESSISIDAVDIVISNGGQTILIGGSNTTAGGSILSSSNYVVSGEIIPAGAGGMDTNGRGSEESDGASSFWGSCPAPGAGGQGHGGPGWGSSNHYSRPGPGMVMLEWS